MIANASVGNRMSRRKILQRSSIGFGGLAFHCLQHASTATATPAPTPAGAESDSLPTDAALGRLHHRARAKNVIFCFMSGGVSHVDSFDPKPRLQQLHGQPMPLPIQRTQFNQNGNVMASPFSFAPGGTSGLPVSDMFPQLREVADELAVVRSMTTPVNEHAQGNFFMHTGFPTMGHPTAGAWCGYGLGTANQNLPAYVVLQSGTAIPPHGGVSLYSNGFLPAAFQGSILQADRAEAIPNIRPHEAAETQLQRLDFARRLNRSFWSETGEDAQVEGAIRNYETAFRMQTAVPELCDISSESAETLTLYGIESADQEEAAYGRQCLLARRLVEQGVRFVELSCLTKSIGAGGAANPWDQHGDLERGHRLMGRQVDQPIAGLIQDLRRRGLLDETLIVWAGEFGRTPFSQGSDGRDHNPFGFSIWMAGGGIRGGTSYGETDELGYHAVEDQCTVYDMWATVLHQLGIDHHRLTHRHSGRDFRLTDVHGNVLTKILS